MTRTATIAKWLSPLALLLVAAPALAGVTAGQKFDASNVEQIRDMISPGVSGASSTAWR